MYGRLRHKNNNCFLSFKDEFTKPGDFSSKWSKFFFWKEQDKFKILKKK